MMKRFQSAFAVPSGFAVSANAGKAPKPGRRSENAHRVSEPHANAPTQIKPRSTRDIRVRAA